MSTLNEYIKGLPRNERGKFRRKLAKALGVSEVMIRHMANGIRAIPAEHAPGIERATGGAVKAEALCPKVDWAYIRSSSRTDQAA